MYDLGCGCGVYVGVEGLGFRAPGDEGLRLILKCRASSGFGIPGVLGLEKKGYVTPNSWLIWTFSSDGFRRFRTCVHGGSVFGVWGLFIGGSGWHSESGVPGQTRFLQHLPLSPKVPKTPFRV